MKTNDVSIRLSAKGKDELLKTFREMGGEFEQAAKKIDAGTKKANSGLKALDATSSKVKDGLQGMANRGGAVGSVLSNLGPIGLAAAAGIGAMAAALSAAMKISREAISAFDKIGKTADTLLLSTDAFQALNSAAIDEGVEFSKVEQAVRALDKRTSELLANQGELYSRLKEINPQLVEMLRNTVDNDARLRIMTDALINAKTATERATIAYAAFGKGGADVARLLVRQADGMDGMIARAKELGLVVDEKLIRSAEDLENQFGQASKVIDLQLKQAFIDLAPVMLESAQLMADLATGLADFVGMFKELDEKSDRLFDKQLNLLSKRVEEIGIGRDAIEEALKTGQPVDTTGAESALRWKAGAQIAVDEFNRFAAEAARRAEEDRWDKIEEVRRRRTAEQLEAEKADLTAGLAELAEKQKQWIEEQKSKSGDDGGFVVNPYAKEGIESRRLLGIINAEMARRGSGEDAAVEVDPKRVAELNALRREAAKLQKDLGDYTLYLAEQTANYKKLLDEGLISQSQYDAAVKKVKDSLSGLTDATKQWQGLLASTLSPVDQVNRKIIDLKSDFAAGRIEVDLYNASLAELQKQLGAARDAETKSKPGYADAEKIRGDLGQAATDALTPAEKLQREQERVNALVKSGQLQGDDATDWLKLYADRLREAANSTGLLGQAEQILDGIQAGRIKTLSDLGRAFSAMLVDMVRNYLAAQTKMGGGASAGGFLDFLMGGKGGGGGGFISQIASFFGGGAGASPAAPPVHIVGQSHSGGSGAQPPARRNLGRGMMPGEHLQVVRDSETILTASGRMNIAGQVAGMAAERQQMAGLVGRALSGGKGQGELKVVINNHAGAEVSTEKRDGKDGPEVSIDIRKSMKDMVRGGVFDSEFKRRYGLQPVGA